MVSAPQIAIEGMVVKLFPRLRHVERIVDLVIRERAEEVESEEAEEAGRASTGRGLRVRTSAERNVREKWGEIARALA